MRRWSIGRALLTFDLNYPVVPTSLRKGYTSLVLLLQKKLQYVSQFKMISHTPNKLNCSVLIPKQKLSSLKTLSTTTKLIKNTFSFQIKLLLIIITKPSIYMYDTSLGSPTLNRLSRFSKSEISKGILVSLPIFQLTQKRAPFINTSPEKESSL